MIFYYLLRSIPTVLFDLCN
uniref:Uncharacterized protein n=1 Tax=Anguilla anguilla TaxID=7936 RepID=A0A0E9WDA4_ANGAN